MCVCLCVKKSRADTRLMFNPTPPPPRRLSADRPVRRRAPTDITVVLEQKCGLMGLSRRLRLVHLFEELALWAQPGPCPQCKHSSEPLSLRADMLAGALLSLWRLTKVQAGGNDWTLAAGWDRWAVWQSSHPVIRSLASSFQGQWQLNVKHKAHFGGYF